MRALVGSLSRAGTVRRGRHGICKRTGNRQSRGGRLKAGACVAVGGCASLVAACCFGSNNGRGGLTGTRSAPLHHQEQAQEKKRVEATALMPPPPPSLSAAPSGAGGGPPPKHPPPKWAVPPPSGARMLVYKDGAVVQEVPLVQVRGWVCGEGWEVADPVGPAMGRSLSRGCHGVQGTASEIAPPSSSIHAFAGEFVVSTSSRLLPWRLLCVMQLATVFGRNDMLSDVLLDHPSISRQHAFIAFEAGPAGEVAAAHTPPACSAAVCHEPRPWPRTCRNGDALRCDVLEASNCTLHMQACDLRVSHAQPHESPKQAARWPGAMPPACTGTADRPW